jgi:CRISPR-associated endoribonuclease Cas6
MPFSIVINGFPKENVPVPHVQGPALQGMFLHLMDQVDPSISERLHDDRNYRPYTLSPLGIGERGQQFRGFQLAREDMLRQGTACYLRITFLEDELFPTFGRYFLARPQPAFRLGETEFTVTSVLATSENDNKWSRYISYEELLVGRGYVPAEKGYTPTEKGYAPANKLEHRIKLRFVTPTSFSKGDIDLPLPLPRLVFQSYFKRFQEFYPFAFLPEFVEQVDRYTGISSMKQLRTDTLKTKRVTLTGFTGDVSFEISKKAPPDLLRQMQLLADFAFFCGTGKKTTVGMGQTVRSA